MLFLSEGRRTEPSPPLNLPNAQAGGETGLTLIVFKRDKKQDLKCAVRVLGDGEGKKEEWGRAANRLTLTVMHSALKRGPWECDNGGYLCSHCYLLLNTSRNYVVLLMTSHFSALSLCVLSKIPEFRSLS